MKSFEATIAGLEATLADRSALVRQWEDYATHWETRARDAERLNGEWETSFDALQDQYSRLALEHAGSAREGVEGAPAMMSGEAAREQEGKQGTELEPLESSLGLALDTPRLGDGRYKRGKGLPLRVNLCGLVQAAGPTSRPCRVPMRKPHDGCV
jgi:hypothetical protein